jgi:hypothetical protein
MSPEEMADQIKKLAAMVVTLSIELADAKETISLALHNGLQRLNLR